jgi:hypothetical protein
MDQLDDFEALADHFGAQLRLTRLRPSGRGADVWDRLHPTQSQQRRLYDWLVARGDNVLTGDSFFHLAAYGAPLDGTPATIRALPAIADAVGDQIEVVLDGGVRRGSDVVKALALGARAVMIGRAYLWGLAANGQAGVENVLDIMRSGIDSALLGLGRESVRELSAADLLIPEGFQRRLGVSDELGAPAGGR